MDRVKVIVNPRAGRGHAETLVPRIRQSLDGLGVNYELVHTSGPGDGSELARQAVDQAFDTVVAVGGDGTSQEVVNGLLAAGNGTPAAKLAWIPAGSGNDFAAANHALVDVEEACGLIAQGHSRVVDAGRCVVDDMITRYFDNVVGIGFDGLVVQETRKAKRARGLALYLPAVLRTVFLTLSPINSTVVIDGVRFEASPVMIVICNGPREGGGFLISPSARIDDGLLDIMIADTMPRLSMLGLIPRFLKGTHLSDRRVSLRNARHIEITSADPLYFHADGELLCDHAHCITVDVLPASLRVICPPES